MESDRVFSIFVKKSDYSTCSVHEKFWCMQLNVLINCKKIKIRVITVLGVYEDVFCRLCVCITSVKIIVWISMGADVIYFAENQLLFWCDQNFILYNYTYL